MFPVYLQVTVSSHRLSVSAVDKEGRGSPSRSPSPRGSSPPSPSQPTTGTAAASASTASTIKRFVFGLSVGKYMI
ncbi:hypothetical protein E2C01_014489 [Portunus trituberculatus]|uniref:Uncharacterized protein n=1 Tax=Portunus trituberculatus TaxID=210409 RepID=A0A5B7DKA8_PORTR|nr:hypothetical protein [Portunus trituberculatus]